MTESFFIINGRKIGVSEPTYIIAEMSANHQQSLDTAVKILKEAKKAGADAVKLQTYTPDTLTIDCDNEHFRIGKGTIWEGRTLYDLYKEAYTPWEWYPKLKKVAKEIGIDLFSTPFDDTAVDFLESFDVPVYKVASFENVDIPLLRKIAITGKPIIMSTGMATLAEIDEAVQVIREMSNNQLALLKCTSAYPAQPEDMNLCSIPLLMETFHLPVGLSDHSLDPVVPVTAVALGACIVEKHFTLSRDLGGADSAFSLEPHEFKTMVDSIHTVEKAIGTVHYGMSQHEKDSRVFRRSLFVVEDMRKDEVFTLRSVRSIRPGYGLHPRDLDLIIGLRASKDIKRGTPLNWSLVCGDTGHSDCRKERS